MIQPPPELPEWFKLAAADGKVGSIELAKLLGIRVTTLDSRVTNGQFPEPDIRQNANLVGNRKEQQATAALLENFHSAELVQNKFAKATTTIKKEI